jgi:hypothetical protein
VGHTYTEARSVLYDQQARDTLRQRISHCIQWRDLARHYGVHEDVAEWTQEISYAQEQIVKLGERPEPCRLAT